MPRAASVCFPPSSGFLSKKNAVSLLAGDLLSAGALHPIPCLKGKKLIANVGKKNSGLIIQMTISALLAL